MNAGLPTEWDIVVVTDWMVARLARLGWLETLNLANTPNFVTNLAPVYRARSFDPNTNLAAPWQSGMTGLGFDFNVTGEQTSIDILFSDDYGGRMTYLDEMRDTVGLSALRLGSDPATITEEQFQAALAEVDKAVKAGYVRQVVGNSYFEVMARGDSVLAMAWSGDVLTSLVPDQIPPPGLPLGPARSRAGCSGPTTWWSRRGRRTVAWPRAGSTSTTTRSTRPRSRRTSTTSARSSAPGRSCSSSMRSSRTTR